MVLKPPNIYSPIDCDVDYFLDHLDERDLCYNKLYAGPDSISDILFAEETPNKIKKICETYGLKEAQSALLSRHIRNIAIANVYIGDLVVDLQSQLDVKPDIARAIANDV